MCTSLVYRLSCVRGGAGDGEHPHEQEDHHLGHVGQHVRRASDGDARVLADVLLDVVLHGDAAEGDGEDAGHVECLRCQIWQVGEYQDDQWLNHSGVIKKSRQKKLALCQTQMIEFLVMKAQM